jgi:hypothetical protein
MDGNLQVGGERPTATCTETVDRSHAKPCFNAARALAYGLPKDCGCISLNDTREITKSGCSIKEINPWKKTGDLQ